MRWNRTQHDWPNFRYDSVAVEPLERRFLLSSGEILGAIRRSINDIAAPLDDSRSASHL
ncbi:MAG: DUF4172 domain-containing protein [Gemmobacter sp.]|nr:DUF4172 domain-containing protein [Gemmobacter sp.]